MPGRPQLPAPVPGRNQSLQDTGVYRPPSYKSLHTKLASYAGGSMISELTQLELECLHLSFTQHAGTGPMFLRLTRPHAKDTLYARLVDDSNFSSQPTVNICHHTNGGVMRMLQRPFDLHPFIGSLIHPLSKVLKTYEPDEDEEERIISVIKYCFALHGKWDGHALVERIARWPFCLGLFRTLTYLHGRNTKPPQPSSQSIPVVDSTQSGEFIRSPCPIPSSLPSEQSNCGDSQRASPAGSEDERKSDSDYQPSVTSDDSDTLSIGPAMSDPSGEGLDDYRTLGSTERDAAQGATSELPDFNFNMGHSEIHRENCHSYTYGLERPSTGHPETHATTEVARASTIGQALNSTNTTETHYRKATIGDLLKSCLRPSRGIKRGLPDASHHGCRHGTDTSVTQCSHTSGCSPNFCRRGQSDTTTSSEERSGKRARR